MKTYNTLKIELTETNLCFFWEDKRGKDTADSLIWWEMQGKSTNKLIEVSSKEEALNIAHSKQVNEHAN